MSNFETALANLKQEIYDDELIKEYFRVRDLVLKNEELKELKQQINDLQIKLSLNMVNPELHACYKRDYEQLLNKYNLHPLISNFTFLQSEVHDFLQNIADLLE